MCSMFSSKALIFCSKTLIYQIKTILITSFLHYEVTGDNLEHIYIQCDFNHFQPYFLSLFKNFNFGDETCITPHVVFFFLLWWTFDFVDRLTTQWMHLTKIKSTSAINKQTNTNILCTCVFSVLTFFTFFNIFNRITIMSRYYYLYINSIWLSCNLKLIF